MLVIYAMNCSFELFSALLLAVMAYALLSKRPRCAFDNLAAVVCLLHLINTLGDLFAWVFTTMSTPTAIALSLAGNVITYLFAPAAYTAFSLYVLQGVFGEALHGESRSSKLFMRGAAALIFVGAVNAMLLVVNFFTPILFHIDLATNAFTWGAWSVLPDNLALVQFCTVLACSLAASRGHGRAEERRGVHAWLISLSLPIIAVLAENVFPTAMLLYLAVALALLMGYMETQHRRETELMQMELELTRSHALLLSGQIRSHFIFNSLFAIQELCYEDPERAARALQDFSDFLRGNMDAVGSEDLVPFSAELKTVRAYIALEQVDPNRSFEVEWHLAAKDFRLPALTVQPVVENAIRHGLECRGCNGVLAIESCETGDAWVVRVRDNGAGLPAGRADGTDGRKGPRAAKPPSKGAGIGLDNVRTRLALECAGALSISSTSEGTTVALSIPKKAVAR